MNLPPVPGRAPARSSPVTVFAGDARPAVRRWPGLATTGIVAWAAMAAAQIVIPLTDRRAGPTVVVVVAATISAWAWAASAWGLTRTGTVLVWVVGSTLAIEWIGTTTGVPFGSYRYTGALQPQVAGVPVIVPLAWFAVGVPALEIAGRITATPVGAGRLRRRAEQSSTVVRCGTAARLTREAADPSARVIAAGRSSRRTDRRTGRGAPPLTGDGRRLEPMLGRWLVAALALTAWDLFLDPQMVGEGYWVWSDGGAYRDIPLTNYLGWFISALVVLAVADRIVAGAGPVGEATDQPRRPRRRADRSSTVAGTGAAARFRPEDGDRPGPVGTRRADRSSTVAGSGAAARFRPEDGDRPARIEVPRADRTGTVGMSVPLLGLYSWWAVMETVGFLAFFGDPLVGVVGGVAMGVPTAMAWRAMVARAGRAGGRGDRSSDSDRRAAASVRFRGDACEPSAPVTHG